ncbi:ATP-binding protein [Sphingomonas sp.]|jgi:two-component system phosphate regulon sensor histidine kinase PhoR|uniref:ATP-binding protein n=1 Tax=Sphingomonas sp. TaxID=28214 RepID=UPI002DE96B43|nr:ATP-binding protein [Sphingomonas sp.]
MPLALLLLLVGLAGLVLLGATLPVLLMAGLVGLAIMLALGPVRSQAAEPPALAPNTPPERHREIIEALADPLLIVGEGRIAEANGAARKLLGPHIVGEDVRVAIRHPAAAERLLTRHEPIDTRPIELVGLGGRETRWQMNLAQLQQGRTLVHLVDRTAGHAAERMRVDFVANASHELRTPLAAIIGFVETLDDESAGGDVGTRKRFLRVIHDEARRMQRLVDDLMSLSRIEAEKFRVPSTAVDLAELIKEVKAVAVDGGGPRGGDIIVDLDESLPFVAGDRAQLSQLLHNLIGNAMKYGRAGTPITVRLDRGPGSMLRLSVEDEGDGIAPEHLPRLTERFYRVDPSRSRSQGGTGLGLAIVKHIVERHRGRLDIQSEVGQGTKVIALLPPAPIPLSSNGNAAVTGATRQPS